MESGRFSKVPNIGFLVLGDHQRFHAPAALCTEYVSAAFYCKTMRGKLLQFSLAPMAFVASSDCTSWVLGDFLVTFSGGFKADLRVGS